MNSITPFSGLSVIIHLLILGTAVVVKAVIKKSGMVFRTPINSPFWNRHHPIALSILSISIILTVALWVSVSTTVALKTALREGALESHSEYVYRNYVYLQRARSGLEDRVGFSHFTQADTLKNAYSTDQVQTIYQPISTNYTYDSVVPAFSLPDLRIIWKE